MSHLRLVPNLDPDDRLDDDQLDDLAEPDTVTVDDVIRAAARAYWLHAAKPGSPTYDDLPTDSQQELDEHVEPIVLAALQATAGIRLVDPM